MAINAVAPSRLQLLPSAAPPLSAADRSRSSVTAIARLPSSVPARPFFSARQSARTGWGQPVDVKSVVTTNEVGAPQTTEQVDQDFENLCQALKTISSLEGISGILGWDELVMMPPGAAASRASQKEALAGVIYEKRTDPEIGRLLDRLQCSLDNMDPADAATVREAARDYKKASAIPKSMATKMARLESDGYQAWVEARESSDFSKFAPVLQEWVDLVREKCAIIDPTRPAYDVCLDDYETGMTTQRLDSIFSKVRDALVPLIKDIREGSKPDGSFLEGEWDVEKQAELCRQVAIDLGFSLEHGRLDVSVHPFTGGSHPTDVRMTTRFKVDDVMEGLTGAIHETGHALYEQGRTLEYDGLPVNRAAGMGIHESQSLLWERMVALSPAFSGYLSPKLQEAFPDMLKGKSADDLYRGMNIVKERSMIRVESDELTYPLHIILRYELERGLIDGSIAVKDLPELWNERMAAYLGCTPSSDAEGVLQDVHWSAGAFGYFPTYSLGAMYACQIFKEAERDLPGLSTDIEAGDFGSLKGWLNKNVHEVGSLYPTGDALMNAVTGLPLDPQVYLNYLSAKYSSIYQLHTAEESDSGETVFRFS